MPKTVYKWQSGGNKWREKYQQKIGYSCLEPYFCSSLKKNNHEAEISFAS